jgi:hypothetical protein
MVKGNSVADFNGNYMPPLSKIKKGVGVVG